MKKAQTLGLLLCAAVAATGCSRKSPEQNQAAPAPAAQPAPAAAPEPPAGTAAARQKAPADAKVSFDGVKDGDTVTSPFRVGFAVTGLKVAPAGTNDAGTGHFHLLIDADLPGQDAALPVSDKVKHYGKGQTEDMLTLPPGPHTLQIEFADGGHVPFDPPVVSDKITVTVK